MAKDALCKHGGGEIRLVEVTVVGTGIHCEKGGSVLLKNVKVSDAPRSAVFCHGQGSNVIIEGGSIVGSA